MISAVIGTNKVLRLKSFLEILKGGEITHHLRAENIADLPSLIDARDLFGEKINIVLEQVASTLANKKIIEDNFDAMKSSENLFVFDEPFIDSIFAKKIEKHSNIFVDAREGKEREKDVFALTDAIERKDKKNAWLEWMKIRDLQAELIHGTIWWKVRTLLQNTKTGRGRSAYDEQTLISMSFSLLKMNHEAHRGNVDLKVELEKFILAL